MLGRIPRRLVTKNVVLRSRISRISATSARYYHPRGSGISPGISCLATVRNFSSALLKDEEPILEQQRSVEDQYSRKTPLEHVLLRPGMYIGPVERLPPDQCWVLDDGGRMVRREYALAPALIKIFDEILVNASDNRMRYPDSCTRIDVTIDPGTNKRDPFISVYNNGDGIPIQIHKTENLYVPELLFGNLLTGSNFDDDEKRITGGRHGYGAKLTNIFSKKFIVETVDSAQGLSYQQTWHNNMKTMEAPIITQTTSGGEDDYTRVSFVPDMPRLTSRPGARKMEKQDYATMCRRVVDVAGCAAGQLEVTLNGKVVSVPSFQAYANLYRPATLPPLCYSRVNDRWEVAIGLSEAGSLDSISFVNGMATTRGGTHVNSVVQQVSKIVADRVAKLYPELADTVNQALIRRHLFVACNALIENPTFDSQMKESLTSGPTSWGSNCNLSDKFLAQLLRPKVSGGPGIVEEVASVARSRQQANLFKEVGGAKKTKRQLLSIPKLEDAHQAGSNKTSACTLILTEGDSAKALAVAGLEVIGRDKFGVFPLRGKFLNVRDAPVRQVAKNAEVKALCSILGLDFDKEYDTVKERAELRYGHVMLMTDQDNDGSHIKGLIMNFFRHFWPKILKPAVDQPLQEPFLSSFVTPLLKATRKKGDKEVLSFYSMAEYNSWRSSLENPEDVKNWTLKYYKGLGTSTPAEAKEYFAKFDQHVRPFHWNSETDGELLDMIFDKKRAADRRDWILEEYDEKATIVADPENSNAVSYEDFVNKEMIHFSNADNVRSLPSVIDGLKPSQRKVLYACFKRKLTSEVKVAQLTGYCAEHTAYHHGEASLQSTIIGMAQDFVGSNNINLLTPQGQFGTRLAGGKDAASPRYIFTHLTPAARLLFPEDDDILLEHREDDGQTIEPFYYCPIIPLLLVNGSMGIGTGWSTFIPPHNPKDVLSYIRAKLDKEEELPSIRPWAKGFTGEIARREDGKGFSSLGKAKKKSATSVLISELPIGRWTNDYKDVLLKMRDKGEIQSFLENHTTEAVSFTVSTKTVQLARMLQSGLEKVFKLESSLPTTNMNAFDTDNTIVKFNTAEEIADAYFPTRYNLYVDRKSVLQSEMNYNATMMRNKARFIQAVADGEIDLVRQSQTKEETVGKLVELGFDDSSTLATIRRDNALRNKESTEPNEELIAEVESDEQGHYDYLLNMPISSLNAGKIQELHRDAEKNENQLDELRKTSPEDLWRNDLDRLEAHL